MQPLQRMFASDGYEVALFPLEYLNMSQDEGGDFSHQGTYNLDFLGWNSLGRVYNCPIYAPCTMRVVAYVSGYAGGNMVIFQSVSPVHLADGSLDYLCISFAHDSSPPYTTVGQVVGQGQICYHTGRYGYVTGDHVHTCCGKGTYQGLTDRGNDRWDLTNRVHYWNAVYVNDTTIINGYNHNWIEYDGGVVPPTPEEEKTKKHKFPWAIYSRKFRLKMR